MPISRPIIPLRCHFAAGLNRRKPLAAGLANGYVANITQHVAAGAITQPTQLGQKDTAIALVKLAALRITEAVPSPFFLEARKIRPLLEKMNIGVFQVFEHLLQGL